MGPTERKGRPAGVYLVEDHPVVCLGLKKLIESEGDLRVVGQSASLEKARKYMCSRRPDAIIVDIMLSDGNGLSLVRDIHQQMPDLPILVFSMHEEKFYAERALRAGATGYVSKADAVDRIVDALREVLSGRMYISRSLATRLLARPIPNDGDGNEAAMGVERLTDREFEVFELIGRGVSTRDIAKRLGISVKTVDAHREHIKQKLSVGNATELLTYAILWVRCGEGPTVP